MGFDYYGDERYTHETEVAVFDSPEALARQMQEAVRDAMYHHDEWNQIGEYEYRVEPSTAEGCMWYGLFHKGPMYEVMKAYTNADSLWEAWDEYCRYKNDDSLFEDAMETLLNYTLDSFYKDNSIEDRKFGALRRKRIPYIEYDATDYDDDKIHEVMEAAQTLLPAMKWYWNTHMLEVMSTDKIWSGIQFRYDYGSRYDNSMRHSFTPIYKEYIWKAIIKDPKNRIRMNETVRERNDREAKEYYESEEGQAEMKEHEERHQEMMTYMGESGLNCYTMDEDGRYTMWRE
jgi:hypothetical protein